MQRSVIKLFLLKNLYWMVYKYLIKTMHVKHHKWVKRRDSETDTMTCWCRSRYFFSHSCPELLPLFTTERHKKSRSVNSWYQSLLCSPHSMIGYTFLLMSHACLCLIWSLLDSCFNNQFEKLLRKRKKLTNFWLVLESSVEEWRKFFVYFLSF